MKKNNCVSVRYELKILWIFVFILTQFTLCFAQPQMENLSRGLVAIKNNDGNIYLSWRLLGDEVYNTAFNIYRNGTLITNEPVADKTNYVDTEGTLSDTYIVKPLLNGVEGDASESVSVWESPVLSIDLNVPSGGTLGGSDYTYSPNDCSVGDLDGDGVYDIVVKWDPSNSKDNSQDGYTGNVYLDAYKLDGTRLWRIDLGVNVRAGAHYTQFIVYDLDLDGKAEVVCRTCPGTKDGTGNYLSKGSAASDDDSQDYRDSRGRNNTSPEYLTCFNGLTGAEMSTINFDPARGAIKSWGDSNGNRGDRFLAGVAYLDGVHPSVIMGRGYYQPRSGYNAKCGVAAFNFNGADLSRKWVFWANTATGVNTKYIGQGTHSLSVADVDQDGYDEIVYGSMVIDHDGTGLYSTGWGHGDALHVSDLDPDHPGLEVFMPHEETDKPYGISFRDARTGDIIWGFDASFDVGRGLAADVDPRYKGYECWASDFGIYSCKGEEIYANDPGAINHIVYWDGDLLCELLDGGYTEDYKIMKYDYENNKRVTKYNLSTVYGAKSNNTTKRNPGLTADLWGDWREEIITRNSTNDKLLIFNTTIETEHKLYCLMHDPQYRCAIAWQNTAYNQPPHPSYYLGEGMSQPTAPNIDIVGKTPKARYELTSSLSGWGAITPASGKFLDGESVVVTALPDDGWKFDGWSGDVSGQSESMTLVMDNNKNVVASFSLQNPTGTNVYQAEKGSFSSGSVDVNHTGYTGSGFVNTDNAADEWVDIKVYAPFDGAYSVVIYYANGSSDDRAVSAIVGDEEQIASISMQGDGDWDSWQTVEISLALQKGENTIRFKALTAGGVPNLDKIELTYYNSSMQTSVSSVRSNEDYVCYSIGNTNKYVLKVNSSVDGQGTVFVLNLSGVTIYTLNIPIEAGHLSTEINLDSLRAGMYLLVLDVDKSRKLVKKLVIH